MGSHTANPFAELYRMCNDGTNAKKYEIIKENKLTIPRYLDVELTNFCNFKCCFCPTGTNSMQRTRGFMPDAVIDSLLENVERHRIPGVRVIGWGEPTLHPRWLAVLKSLKSVGKGCLVHLGTNGSLLHKEEMQMIADLGIDSIKFSFQGADSVSYNEMRDGGDYHRLIDVVKKMKSIRGDRKKPFIQISTTLTTESPEMVEHFRREIEPYCDYCNIGYTMLNHLSVDGMNVTEERRKKIREMQQNEAVHHVFRKVCSDAFDKLDIHWNGDATLCCSDYESFLLVGNIMDRDIKDIFTSKIANMYRGMIVNGEQGRIKCCSTCWETVPLT